MKRIKNRSSICSIHFFFLLAILIGSGSALEAAEASYSRQIRYGYTQGYFPASNGEFGNLNAPGLVYRYEFVLKPKFQLGINVTYRHVTGYKSNLQQLGYGLIMQHYLGDKSKINDKSGYLTYVSYGLLMQVLMVEGKGNGTAHDTRSAVGGDFPVGELRGFWELGYNYSVISYFEQPKLKSHHLDVSIGLLRKLSI